MSKRTIYRDIEELCKAGIPVITFQGGDGGIMVAEDYKFDKNILTIDELDNILIGLHGIGSVSRDTLPLIEKLSPKHKNIISASTNIHIDLSSFGQNRLLDSIGTFRTAIKSHTEVTFQYFTASGSSVRTIEPYFIIFEWGAWYVRGFCKLRADFRMFKLTRMVDVKLTNAIFTPKSVSFTDITAAAENYERRTEYITILADPEFKYKIIDAAGPDSFSLTDNGKIEFKLPYTDFNDALALILSFGDKVKVISPQFVVDNLTALAENILARYN